MAQRLVAKKAGTEHSCEVAVVAEIAFALAVVGIVEVAHAAPVERAELAAPVVAVPVVVVPAELAVPVEVAAVDIGAAVAVAAAVEADPVVLADAAFEPSFSSSCQC